jgi:hypothetical protein
VSGADGASLGGFPEFPSSMAFVLALLEEPFCVTDPASVVGGLTTIGSAASIYFQPSFPFLSGFRSWEFLQGCNK